MTAPAKRVETAPTGVEASLLAHAAERARMLGVEAPPDDREVRGVIRNFVIEIEREAIDARRAMLECACVEVLLSDRPAAELSRAERALRGLDPLDVIELRALAGAEEAALPSTIDPIDRVYFNGVARRRALDASPSRDALELGGFVGVDRTLGGRYGHPAIVTPRGDAVLAVLAAWGLDEGSAS